MMRHTPLTRKKPIVRVKPEPGILRTAKLAAPSKPTLAAKPKRRKCRVCKTPFITFSSLECWCSLDCGLIVAQKALSKKKAREAAEVRQNDRKRREALKTIPELKREAQRAFNAFIRERDRQAGHPCISSGRPLNWNGNDVDAGHYRSTGSADHLRFNEDNCHAQSKQDNRFGAGRAVEYRINLIKRIGLERVEALEADNAIVKWTREDLIAIKKLYQEKLKELQKAPNKTRGM